VGGHAWIPPLLFEVEGHPVICLAYFGERVGVEIKIVATGCQILRLKLTTFDFAWGSAQDPAEGGYRATLAPSYI